MKILTLKNNLSLVQARDGMFLVNSNDIYVGKALELYGEYGYLEADFLYSYVARDDYIIEVGANIGAHTVGLAKRVGDKGRVYAFEPQPSCYALIQAQIALNQITNIYAYNKGIGDQETTLWLPPVNYNKPGNFGGISLTTQQDNNHLPIEVCTLDSIFRDSSIDLLKIDVEGMEGEVIKGARELINRCKPILYVENDRVEKSPSLIALLLELGYRLWWHMPPLFNPHNFFENEYNAYGNIVSVNMLCIHSSKCIKQPDLFEITSPEVVHPIHGG